MNPKPISTYDPSSVSCLGEGIFDAFFSKWINDECVSNTLVSNGYNNMCHFPFTGKEKDAETGYHYFGARYYDSELLTGWLSVDPMADKYPSISPYAYCAWNPIRLTDPDGREMNPVYNYKGNLLGCTNEGFTGKIIIYDGENTSFEGMSSDDFVSANYSAEYYDMDNECRLDNVAKESMYRNILSNYDGTDINGYTFYQQDITP